MKSTIRKILSTVLAVAMIGAMSTNVFASEVESGDYEDMVLVASYTEDLGNGETIVKELRLSPNQMNNSRGFSDTRYGSVTHSHYKNNGDSLSLRMTAYADFHSQLGTNTVAVGNASFNTETMGSHWSFYGISDYKASGEGSAQYSVYYSTTNGVGGNNYTAWIRCDSNGSVSNNTGNYRNVAPQSNQVIVGDSIISFG